MRVNIELALGLAIVLSAAVAYGAYEWGRSPLLWFVLSILITPVLSGVFLLVLGADKEGLEEQAVDAGSMRRCTKCDEAIRRDALRCRHCGYEPAESKKVVAGPLQFACKKCGQPVEARADLEGKFIKCSKCQTAVYVPYPKES